MMPAYKPPHFPPLPLEKGLNFITRCLHNHIAFEYEVRCIESSSLPCLLLTLINQNETEKKLKSVHRRIILQIIEAFGAKQIYLFSIWENEGFVGK